MPPAKFTTQIIVTETKATYQGRNRQGGSYTLYQVIATKPDGTAIDMALRAFVDLPKRRVITVEAELYTSETYGPSYTLTLKDTKESAPPPQQQAPAQQQRQPNGLETALQDLLKRVKRIEDFLSGRGEFVGSARPEPQSLPEPGPSTAPPPEGQVF